MVIACAKFDDFSKLRKMKPVCIIGPLDTKTEPNDSTNLDYLGSSIKETGFKDPEINNEDQRDDLMLGFENYEGGARRIEGKWQTFLDVFAIDVSTSEGKWKSIGCHAAGIVGLSFPNRGHILHTVCNGRIASEMNSKTGEFVWEFKVSKTHISSLALCAEQILAISSGKMRIFNWESGKELLKFSADGGSVQRASIFHEAKAIITFGSGEKYFQVPESGVAYAWNLITITEEGVTPTKEIVKAGIHANDKNPKSDDETESETSQLELVTEDEFSDTIDEPDTSSFTAFLYLLLSTDESRNTSKPDGKKEYQEGIGEPATDSRTSFICILI
ncbi:hypothetical protein Vadar_029762 [Vaccinium darrowii]|uniref:Uncharacterized protein n=1 Tax=Vaccinium darrowii TaxID=229202 RepID=A0ACB7XDC0_9ERIC|nr:hypothetical protein Vadar_029762 [Vaccinium darrowii]